MKKPAKKKPAKIDPIDAKRARAYADMESHVCDLVSMGTIAMDQFDKNQSLFVFAVGKLEDHVERIQGALLRRGIPDMKRRRRSVRKRNRQRIAAHSRRRRHPAGQVVARLRPGARSK